MANTVLMKMLRDYQLRSTLGHTVVFKKMEPTPVPRSLVNEAMNAGAVPCDEDDLPKDEAQPAAPELSTEERADIIEAAVEASVLENKREDFTAGGKPTTENLSKRAEFEVTAAERDAAWEKYQEENTHS